MLEIAERNNEPLPVVTAYLLDYKNMHFNRNQIEKAAEDKIEKELGIKERTVSEWRRVFKFSIRNGMAVINRLNTDEKAEEYEDLAKTSELDTVLGDAFARLMLCFMVVDGEICRSEEETFRKTFREFAEQLESYDDLGGNELYRALMEE